MSVFDDATVMFVAGVVFGLSVAVAIAEQAAATTGPGLLGVIAPAAMWGAELVLFWYAWLWRRRGTLGTGEDAVP